MHRLIFASLVLITGGCMTEIHVNGDGNTVHVQTGPQSALTAGRDAIGNESTADVQLNPVTSFLPW